MAPALENVAPSWQGGGRLRKKLEERRLLGAEGDPKAAEPGGGSSCVGHASVTAHRLRVLGGPADLTCIFRGVFAAPRERGR